MILHLVCRYVCLSLSPSPALPPLPLPTTRGTCHIRWAELIRSAPDAQLAVVVGAPALDPTPESDRAHVALPRGNGDGGQAWVGVEGESLCAE